jgi:hypothetical protein
MSYFAEMKTSGSICGEKKMLSAEDNVRPNRDDSGYVLIITLNVDLGSDI